MSAKQQIDKLATQCVKCGLCLPHCPTYVVARNENESPRGRIALMQGAVREQVPISEKLMFHIDTCLACRACEAVCPAGVQYDELFTTARAWLKNKPSFLERSLIVFLEHPRLRKWLAKLIRVYQSWRGFRWIAAKLRAVKLFSLAQYIPANKTVIQKPITLTSTHKKALLLSPCVSELFDQKTLQDAQQLIAKLGWNPIFSDPSYCCGALSLHAGELEQAKHCAQHQTQQWDTLQPDVILSLANGCHATLQEYGRAPLSLSVPKIPLQTIEQFTLEHIQGVSLLPLAKRVVVHTPCTLRNAIRKPALIMQLLEKIPEITCISIPSSMGCCGAAGTNFLRHPDIAQKLVDPIVEFIRKEKPDCWVTSNIGCMIYVQQALQLEGIDIPVMHPISLIAHQIAGMTKHS